MQDEHDSSANDFQPFDIRAAIATFCLLEGLVVLQGWLAYRDHFLTPAQMQAHGVGAGLPFMAHLGMWGDVFIISPLAAYIVGRFLRSWQRDTIIESLVIGLALSTIMHWSYLSSNIMEAHVQNGALTPAGWVHAAYMSLRDLPNSRLEEQSSCGVVECTRRVK
jgi:hypothetical protein